MTQKVPHLPQTGAMIVEHEQDEDAGRDRFNCYVMLGLFNDHGKEVFILRSDCGRYVAATHADFEFTHRPYSDDSTPPRMHVVTPGDKPILRTENDGKDIVVTFDVSSNRYQVSMPAKSSDKVFSDVVNKLHEIVNESNFKHFIGTVHTYKVKWRKDHYLWQAT